MNQIVQNVSDFFDSKGMKYDVLSNDLIKIVYTGDNMPEIQIILSFDESGKRASIYSFSIAKVTSDNVIAKAKAHAVCNILNQKWRWFKFYLDTNDEFTASADAIIDPYTAGEECYELIQRMVRILDESYPMIMKSVWS